MLNIRRYVIGFTTHNNIILQGCCSFIFRCITKIKIIILFSLHENYPPRRRGVIDTFGPFVRISWVLLNKQKYLFIPFALRALPLRKWESCDKLLHSLVRGRRETVAPFATPMRNKHCLRRREIYLPRGVCFSTKIYLPRGVPKGRVRRRGVENSIAIMFLFKTEVQKNRRLSAMRYDVGNTSKFEGLESAAR